MVTAGQPLLQLTSLQLESATAQSGADLRLASNQSYNAMLHYGNFGAAEYKRQEMAERNRTLTDEMSQLRILSPIGGVVATPNLEDLVGSYLPAGTPIAEIADPSTFTARIYIPEFGMKEAHTGAEVRLQTESEIVPITAKLASIAPASTEIEPGLIPKDQLKGIVAPRFYVGSVFLNNSSGELREGMTGNAKILVARRSLAALMWIFMHDLVARRVW